MTLTLLILCTVNRGFGQDEIDSLKIRLTETLDSNNSEVYLQLFVRTRFIDLDSALFFAEKSRQVAYQYGDSMMFVRGQIAVGWSLQQKGLYAESIEEYERALSTARRNNFADREKFVLNYLGLAHYHYGSYEKALEYHYESLKIREEQNDKRGIAVATNNIGLVYYQIKDYVQAISFFKRSLDLKRDLGDLANIEVVLTNLGNCYAGLYDYNEALKYFNEVLEKCDESCSEKVLVEVYNGMAIAQFSTEDFLEAEDNFIKSNVLAEEVDSRIHTINLHYLAKINLRKDNIEEAISFLDKSQAVALEVNYRPWVKENYKLYGELYSTLSEFEKAYRYQKNYDSLNRDILNEDVITNLAKVQADYQERENLQTIEDQDQEISRATTLLVLSVVIIILISIILFILYRINQLRRKANRQLSEAKNIIERQNNVLEEKVKERTKELKETNAALMKSNTDLDNFIYKTSHDIRGPLATLQGMCNVALIDINDSKSRDYFEKIGRTAYRLNEILSKLLIINQINNSLITAQEVDLKRLSKDIVKEQSKLAKLEAMEIDNQIKDFDDFKSDEVLLKIILGNLISNAFKFHNTSNRVNSWVRLEAHRENGHLELSVIDNGIGVDEKASSKIFDIFSKASEVSDTAGLGLYLVKLAVEKLDGRISHSKTPDGYTKFTVELPA